MTCEQELNVLGEVNLQLKNPYTMMIAGPTKCGKTTFVGNLLKNFHDVYTKPPNKVFYFYNQIPPSDLNIRFNVHEFIEGLPTMKFLRDMYVMFGRNLTIVIDDQALNVNKGIAELFSVGSSRYFANIIFITQNLFGQKNENRDISKNCSYFVLCKNPRDSASVYTFFRQSYPRKYTAMTQAYDEATGQPYTYLFVDMHQETPDEHRILSNIFSENGCEPCLYLLEK